MDIQQEIVDAKIAAKDVIVDLERAMDRVRAVMIKKTGSEIHAMSPELFKLNLVLVRTHAAAAKAKAELLELIGMPAYTRFVALPGKR
jgi:hypothetical protein